MEDSGPTGGDKQFIAAFRFPTERKRSCLHSLYLEYAEAAAAGGLTVSAVMMAAPTHAVGIVVSNLSTASTIEGVRIDELARDQTASQIFDLNRQRLRAMARTRGEPSHGAQGRPSERRNAPGFPDFKCHAARHGSTGLKSGARSAVPTLHAASVR